MSQLIDKIIQVCSDHPLAEKWLLAPTLRVGWQWIDAATKQGRPLVNVHCKTIQGAVLDAVTPHLVKHGLRFASRMHGVLLLESIWRRLDPATNYFRALEPNLALFERIYASLQDLRASGEDKLHVASFESPSKAKTLQVILKLFTESLKKANLIDYADALRIAGKCVKRDDGLIVMLPDDVELNAGERKFLQLLTVSHLSLVDDGNRPQPKRDIDLLYNIEQPIGPDAAFNDGSVSLYHAMGEANEVREIFRRCLQNKIPLDQVEIVFTDAVTYIPLLYELSFEPRWTDEAPDVNLPMTFADGIPVLYSKPGKALLAWAAWVSQGYLQTALVSLYQDHLIKHDSSLHSYEKMAQALRRLPIGFGRERTLDCIRNEIQSLNSRLENLQTISGGENDETDTEQYRQFVEREISRFQLLQDEVESLLQTTPALNGSLSDIVQKAMKFCDSFTNGGSNFHRLGRERLVDRLKQLCEIVHANPDIQNVDGWKLVTSIPAALSIVKSAPKPGHIHASHFMSGGHSDRPHIFIVGLDDGRFPGAGSQDPIILDKERSAISTGLVTSRDRVQRKVKTFNRLLSRLQGEVTLSFSCRNLIDDREQFASPVVLAVYRAMSGDHQADYSSLNEWLGVAASFAPNAVEQCVNVREADLLNAAGARGGSMDSLFERYPHFKRGMKAQQNRGSNKFTIYDGWVAAAGPMLNFTSGRAASASALETLGRCPLAFFFQYGLKIEESEAFEGEEDQWLDALVFGSLVHSLFEEFIAKRIERNERVSFSEHRQELIDMAEREIERHRAMYPPKAEHSFIRQCEQLFYCIDCFLHSEESLQQNLLPQFVEAKIGYEIDDEDAVLLSLSNGEQINVRGIIDRIDAIGDPGDARFAIWDYKTGSSFKYGRRQQKKKWDALQQGRVIQHALYTAMARQWLKRAISGDADVEQFGYFFPSEKGKGERLTWTAQELTHAGNVLFHLNQIASTGAFLPTNDADDCSFCHYQSICGDVETVASYSQAKLDNPETVRLAPMKELRNDGR